MINSKEDCQGCGGYGVRREETEDGQLREEVCEYCNGTGEEIYNDD